MGVRDYEMISDPHLWQKLEAQIDEVKSIVPAFRSKPRETALDFSKAVTKVMLLFEEICQRRID